MAELVTPNGNDHWCECSACAEHHAKLKRIETAVIMIGLSTKKNEFSESGYSVSKEVLFRMLEAIAAEFKK
jgi:hypothetical protein